MSRTCAECSKQRPAVLFPKRLDGKDAQTCQLCIDTRVRTPKHNAVRCSTGRFIHVVTGASDDSRVCSKCNLEKDISLFGRSSTGLLGRKSTCKKCDSAAVNAYNKRNREKVRKLGRKIALRKQYGLTPEDYEAIFDAQGRVCRICGTGENRGVSATFPVDHCHVTGKVRGILCNCCNWLVGQAKDDTRLLQAAIEYLNASAHVSDGFKMVTSGNALKRRAQ